MANVDMNRMLLSNGDYGYFTDDQARTHIAASVVSEAGCHGLRYFADSLQGYDTTNEAWFDISSGGGGVSLGDVSGASVSSNMTTATLTWSDPSDIEMNGAKLAEWGGTLVVRKVGSAPASRRDGTVVCDSKTRNAYASTGFQDTGLSYDTTYYYRFFPYTKGKGYTDGSSVSVTPTRTVISAVPSQSGTLTYDGTAKTPVWTGFDASKMDISGDTSGTNAGSYTASFTPKEDYCWSGGSRTAQDVTWTIGKLSFATPVQSGSLIYNGSEQTASFTGFLSNYMTVSGNKATTVGTHTATFTLTDTANTKWDNSNSADISANWVIGDVVITIPTVAAAGFVYNGNVQQPTITNPDSSAINTTGDTSGTDAGTYSITFSLKDPVNTKWSDNTTADIVRTWTIGQAQGTLVLDKNSLTLNADTLSGTVTATVTGGGTLSATTSDSSVASYSISGNTITIGSVGGKSGTATITVSASGTKNYAAPADKTVTVSCEFLKIVSWANGTDEEITALVAAADAGDIDLYDDAGWRVGDERQVQLSAMAATGVGESHAAQTVTMVLVNRGGKTLANGETCQFVMHLKNCLAETGYINSSGTNVNGWNGCARRTWCNSVFKDAIPATLCGIFKQHKNNATAGNKSTSLVESTDWFALPAAVEVGTNTSSPYNTEGTQWSYYTDNTSRIKKLGDSGSAGTWWSRSPDTSSTTTFRCVHSDGSDYNNYAYFTYGIAPFGCI